MTEAADTRTAAESKRLTTMRNGLFDLLAPDCQGSLTERDLREDLYLAMPLDLRSTLFADMKKAGYFYSEMEEETAKELINYLESCFSFKDGTFPPLV